MSGTMLSVTTPATDLALLTVVELRAAVDDPQADAAKIATLGKSVSSLITAACKVARNGAVPPTLRLETVSETIELERSSRYLILARRPIVEVLSGVTENETALTSADYRVHDGSGMLERRNGAYASEWAARCDIVVPYRAGWQTVPDELKAIAAELAQTLWSDSQVSDSNLRSFDVPGVYSETRWVDNSDTSPIPEKLMNRLHEGGFVNHWVG